MKRRTIGCLIILSMLFLSISIPITQARTEEDVLIEGDNSHEIFLRDVEEDDLVTITVNATDTVNVYILAKDDLYESDRESHAEESMMYEKNISLTWSKDDQLDYYLVIENPHSSTVVVDYEYNSVDIGGLLSGFQTCCWIFGIIILLAIIIIIIFLVKYFKGGDDYTDDFDQKGYGKPSYGTDSYKKEDGYDLAQKKNQDGSSRYCEDCGWRVSEDSNYCEHCGKKLK